VSPLTPILWFYAFPIPANLQSVWYRHSAYFTFRQNSKLNSPPRQLLVFQNDGKWPRSTFCRLSLTPICWVGILGCVSFFSSRFVHGSNWDRTSSLRRLATTLYIACFCDNNIMICMNHSSPTWTLGTPRPWMPYLCAPSLSSTYANIDFILLQRWFCTPFLIKMFK